jgi:hypothetical protein
VLRGHAGEAEHVLVLQTLGAPQRRLLGRRRAREAAPEPEPTPVTTGRATVVGVSPLGDEAAAGRWLAGADLDDEADGFTHVLNRVLQAQRVAAADPFVREVATDQALVLRVGFGDGDRVAEGRWVQARELPPGAAGRRVERRAAALRPQERVAALLGGRDVPLACEELVLRARLDVDRGRDREAALQARAALDAATAELAAWRARADLEGRLAELETLREPVAAAAAAALRGGLQDTEVQAVEHAVGRIEAALRARTAVGVD